MRCSVQSLHRPFAQQSQATPCAEPVWCLTGALLCPCADRREDRGVKYLIIDAGWYNKPGRNGCRSYGPPVVNYAHPHSWHALVRTDAGWTLVVVHRATLEHVPTANFAE